MNKMKRFLKTVAVATAGLSLAAVTACAPQQGEVRTYEDDGYVGYAETRIGRYMYEIRFTDTDGIKWKCFGMQSGQAGGLDGCEKVG